MANVRQRVTSRIRLDSRPLTLPARALDVATASAGRADVRQRGATVRAGRLNRRRRGVAALWLILALPVLLVLVCFVIEIGNVWLARVELENALEAAALAAVKEWGSAGGGNTQTPRLVGVEYAKANTVTGNQVNIATNYDNTSARQNENVLCSGLTANLIFGAITTATRPWVFNADIEPSCGGGNVLFDASAGPSMGQANAWGINFRPVSEGTPAGLTITRVVIDLRAGGDGNADFNLASSPPQISTGTIYSPYAQIDTSGLSSAALSGSGPWTNGQVTFTHIAPGQLQIDFSAYGGDLGFEPGDRIRFGAQIINLDATGTDNDGDAVGKRRVGVTVTFAPGGTAVGQFFDSNFRKCSVGGRDLPPPDIDPCPSDSRPFVLPEAPASGNNNDDQSYVIAGATSNYALGVRAQQTVNVNSICCRLFGATLPVFNVSACATARYDCTVLRPELIRVTPENFFCTP